MLLLLVLAIADKRYCEHSIIIYSITKVHLGFILLFKDLIVHSNWYAVIIILVTLKVNIVNQP